MVGGNYLVYAENPGSPAASMIETKILLNIIISGAQQGARLMSFYLKYLFLATPILQPGYMKTHIRFSVRYYSKIKLDKQSFRQIYIDINKSNLWAKTSRNFSL